MTINEKINNMTIEDLIELNSRIVKRIKHLRDLQNIQLSLSLNVGDFVSFDGRSRGLMKGVITKINRKTAKVDVNGQIWNVSLTLLEKTKLKI